MNKKIYDEFNSRIKKPLDKRTLVNNLNEIDTPYEGMITHNKTSGIWYKYSQNNFVPLLDDSISINVLDYGMKGDGVFDNSAIFQQLLNINSGNSGKSLIINFPSGVFRLNSSSRVYKNTTIKCTDKTTILRGSIANNPMFTNFEVLWAEETGGALGYNGEGNIHFDGGLYEINVQNYPINTSVFPFCHASNVSFKNMIIRNASGHVHELAGCKDILIYNVRYEGFIVNSGYDTPYQECIQPDIMQATSFPYGGKYDHTPTKNIVIKNCYFGKGDSTEPTSIPYRVAVGNHGSDTGVSISNILVENCTFDGLLYAGLHPCKFSNMTIVKNKFINCATSIYSFSDKNENYDGGMLIKDNDFTVSSATDCIKIEGIWNTAYSNSYLAKGVILSGNKFNLNTNCTAISFLNTDNAIINSNYCNIANRLLVLQQCRGTIVGHNSLNNSYVGFALIWNNCENTTIDNNYSINAGETQINANTGKNLNISNNTFRNNSINANNSKDVIRILGAVDKAIVSKNIITSDTGVTNLPSYGITVSSDCTNVITHDNIISNTVGAKISKTPLQLTLQNSWVTAWAGVEPIIGRGGGLARVTGMIKSGVITANTIIATVPTDYIPSRSQSFIINDWNNALHCAITINTVGEISITAQGSLSPWDNTKNMMLDFTYVL